MDKKKVKTKGTLRDMSQYTNVDQSTIQDAIQVVEQASEMEIEVPEK
ncbi:MAG TPA: hypothetical protein VJ824_03575 [Bacillota bacterium]|nr:hypothetical protein [Bacillota bacterium]